MRASLPLLTLVLTATLADCGEETKHFTQFAPSFPLEAQSIGPSFLNVAPQRRVEATKRSVSYEHRDHGELPVGTRIYYVDGSEVIVRPGQRGPVNRAPDILIVPDEART